MSSLARRPLGRAFWLLPVLVVVVLLAAGPAMARAPRGWLGQAVPEPAELSCAEQPYAEFTGEDRPRLWLEIAATPEDRQRGLMFRQSLDADAGMLFDFGAQTTSGFWMRNTYVPLSIAWIDLDGTIVDIQDMQPLSDEVHAPGASYWFALEANQGWFAEHGVVPGQQVVICRGASDVASS